MKSKLSMREWVAEGMAEVRQRWFPNHQATLETHGPVTVLRWAKPETCFYAVTYLLMGRTLYVSGDIGEAVFQWGDKLTLEFLKGCDFDYFWGKCCASEVGRRFDGWAENVARHDLDALADDDGKAFAVLEGIDLDGEGREAIARASREAYDETGDCELASIIARAGTVPHMRAVGMWVGLQMAHEQLSGKGVEAP